MKFFNELFMPIFIENKLIGYRVVDEFVNNDVVIVVKQSNSDNIPEFILLDDYDYVPIYLQYYDTRVYFIDITNFKIYLIKSFA